MALNGTTTAIAPTAYGVAQAGSKHELVLTLPVKAATSVTANSLVKLTSGYVEECSAVTDKVIGMAVHAADNSSGAAGDLKVAVVIKGLIEQDGLTADATHTAFTPGTLVYLAPAVSDYCAAGQAVSISSASSAVLLGKVMDFVTAPASGSQISKVRVLIDRVDTNNAWV